MTLLGGAIATVMIVVAIVHTVNRARLQREEFEARTRAILAPLFQPPPPLKPIDDGVITYEDRAKWLRADIRKDIEDSFPCPATLGEHRWVLAEENAVMSYDWYEPARIDRTWICTACDKHTSTDPLADRPAEHRERTRP